MQELERLFIEPCLCNLLKIESLIQNSKLIDDVKKRYSATIIATEVFCNIVEHAQVPEKSYVDIIIKKESDIKLEFIYQTENFDKLLEIVKEPKPYYKHELKRYGGLGLIMLKSLAKNIEYKKGEVEASITVTI